MGIPFMRTLYAGWGDMDFNGHMRNTAYLDKSADLRMWYFASFGFPMAEFSRLRLGPVVREDRVAYFREIPLLAEFTVDQQLAGISEDGARFCLQNQFTRADGKLCARVLSSGGWLDLSARALVVPPAALRDAMLALPRTEEFQELPNLSAAG
jgi:acyl-CoA thioester hydrolase